MGGGDPCLQPLLGTLYGRGSPKPLGREDHELLALLLETVSHGLGVAEGTQHDREDPPQRTGQPARRLRRHRAVRCPPWLVELLDDGGRRRVGEGEQCGQDPMSHAGAVREVEPHPQPLTRDAQYRRARERRTAGDVAAHHLVDATYEQQDRVLPDRRDRVEHPLERAEGPPHPELVRGVDVLRQLVQRRDRPRLQEPEPAVRDRPLDVLRRAVLDLHLDREPRHTGELLVVERPFLAGALSRLDAAAREGHGHHGLLAAYSLEHLPAVAAHDVVRDDLAGDQRLAEAERRVDDHAVAGARQRVGGERHTGRLGRDLALYDHGERHLVVRYPCLRPVADRAGRPQRAPAPYDRVQDGVGADDVEVRVLLARERGVGEVLGRRRAAYGNRPVAERDESLTDRAGDLRRHLGSLERSPDQG